MIEQTNNPPDRQDAETYEIRLRGHLEPRWASRLGVPRLAREDNGTTVLSGIAADQAVLHGLLQRLRDLGLPIVSVTRTGPDATIPPNPSDTEPRNPRK